MKEVVGLLEGGSDSVDLMDEVLNANDPMLAQLALYTITQLQDMCKIA